MNWLGHHEFGWGHKSFNLTDKRDSVEDIQSIEYWLGQWLMTYGYILGCYEQVFVGSVKERESLLRNFDINNVQERPKFRLGQFIAFNTVNCDQLVVAEEVYNSLCSLSCSTLPGLNRMGWSLRNFKKTYEEVWDYGITQIGTWLRFHEQSLVECR